MSADIDTVVRPSQDDDDLSGDAAGSGPAVGSAVLYQDALMLLPLLVMTVTLHGVNVAGWPAFFDDEGTYLSQAFATYDGDLAPYTYWYDHPPLGWIQMAAVAWLPGLFVETQLVGGRLAMVLFAIAATTLVYATARRLGLRKGFALAAGALWALSPLTILESRQVLLDTIAVPWLLGAMFLALSIKRHLGHYMAAGLCLGVAVLTKETTVIFAPAILLALWQSSHHRIRPFGLVAFGISFLMSAASYPLFALLKGELIPGEGHVSLIDALIFQLAERNGSGFILDPGSGAYGVLQYWLSFDRVLIIGGVASALLTVLVRRLRPPGVAVLACVLLAMRPDGYLPFMYVTAVLPFAALVIAGLLDQAWRWLARRETRGALASPSAFARWRLGVPRAAMALALIIGSGSLAETWRTHHQVALAADVNSAHPQAVAWMKANVSTNTVVVTDNVLWLDLVEAGWKPGWGVVWFPKLDLDPVARRELPAGWRDIDYVIWSRSFAYLGDNRLPIIEQLYKNSKIVAVFGEESEYRVEIRRVMQ
jgi:hypothetical protein